jgi:hypothetical protein
MFVFSCKTAYPFMEPNFTGGSKGHIWRKLSELFKNSQKPAVDACDICRSHGVLNLRSGVQSLT